MERLLDVESVAGLLGISAWTVRKWLSTHKLRSVRLGRRVLIEPSEVRRLIEEGRTALPYEQAHSVTEAEG